jgi:DNA-binding MarR family transcriptional regulator
MTRNDDLLRLIVAAHALTRLAAIETKNDTPAAQWRTLKLLREYGPQRLGDLATLSRVSQPGMTRLVGQLASAGLVARDSDAADARVQRISVTPAGERALDAWIEQLRDALAPHVVQLDDATWHAISVAADALTSITAVPEVVR